jgi:hypothetical protein
VRMFDYTYRWLGGWLQRPEPRESVILLVGDHQPAASVSGEGASWEVPVHIVTRDPELLARFVALGFTPGLTPQRPALGGMHDLTGVLLRALAEPLPLQAQLGAFQADPLTVQAAERYGSSTTSSTIGSDTTAATLPSNTIDATLSGSCR